jgi:hypothetical protein
MALILADRVKDTTTTAGTGTITLSGTAPTGFQNFSVIGNGNTTYYTIAGQGTSEWEVGIGTYTSSGTTLSRTTVLASSNAGSLVVFSAGTKDVFVTYPAERSVNLSSAALTSGRVPYATTDGLLVDASTLTFNGTGMGIGTSPNTATKLNIAGSLTGATAGYGVLIQPTVQPDVTTNVYLSRSQMSTAANGGTPYTIAASYDYIATQGTFNADSTVTTQSGFGVASALTGATNNYGFLGSIASGTGRYNLYMNGTADNYLAGTLGIGTTTLGGGYALRVTKTFSADNGSGVFSTAIGSSSTPTGLYSMRSSVSTATNSGTPYTVGAVYSYYASQGTFDVDSTVTTQHGYYVSASLTGATNNYGFIGQLASGTGRWNMYMGGTAQNYIAGNVGIGATTPVTKLEIAGSNNSTWSATTTSISGTTMTIAGTVTGTIAIGDLVFGTGVQPYTRITAGSALSWTVSVYQTVASATLVGGATYGDTLIRITETDTSVAAGQPTGGLQFYTSDTSTPTAGVGAYVAAISEAVTPDTSLVFGTRDNAGGGIDANERMRIDSSGNVGIGTSNIPSNKDTVTPKFIVNGAGVAGSMQVVRNTTVGAGGGILELTATRGSDVNSYTILQSGDGVGSVIFGGADGTQFVAAASISCQVDATPGANDMPGRLIFNTTTDGASAVTERMRITSAGGVSFGATGTAYGTSGQVLTSAGDAPPTWATPTTPSTPILINTTTVSSNYTISTGTNGLSVGPMTVASGVAVTVATGQRWLVL